MPCSFNLHPETCRRWFSSIAANVVCTKMISYFQLSNSASSFFNKMDWKATNTSSTDQHRKSKLQWIQWACWKCLTLELKHSLLCLLLLAVCVLVKVSQGSQNLGGLAFWATTVYYVTSLCQLFQHWQAGLSSWTACSRASPKTEFQKSLSSEHCVG